jgi:PAS domain S-box-containing protein
VVAATTAEEAVANAGRGGVELVLLDYQLPGGITGLEVFEQLKSSGHTLPVILVTGYGDQTMVIRALRAGVLDFITKSPEYLDYLPDSVERVLRQVRIERQLAESEARLAGIINSAMDAIITMDQQGKVLEFNPAAEAIFGHDRAQVIGQEMAFLTLPSAPGHEGEQSLTQSLATGEFSTFNQRLEVVGMRADGSQFPAELTVTRMMVQGVPVFTRYVREITEQKRAVEHIREQAALLDKANDAILVRGLDNSIKFWNQSAERIYGWTAAEALGKDLTQLLFKGPSPQFEKIVRTVLTRGEWAGELHQVSKDGKAVTVASRWTLVRDPQGNPVSHLIINSDVTEKKQLETHFLRAQRMESIGTLAGGIAHDLNNVLTPIILAAQLLQVSVPEPKRRSLLEALRRNAERGADMVKQVLSFARGVEGQRVVLQLQSVIKELTKMLEHALPKSIEIKTNLEKGLWLISGDATQLYQVLMNLCVNARDAMPHGGQLTISAQSLTVDESCARLPIEGNEDAYVCIEVSDTGTGMPSDVIDKVFDPFFTTKEPGKGTGLGLSTALSIVRGHGGFISLTSELGKGTTFSVYLPAIVSRRAVHPGGATSTSPGFGNGEVILLVDDEEDVRELTRATLEVNGYRVLTATNGTEALNIYAENGNKIAAVLTDMMMPTMDGGTMIRALYKQAPGVRIIVASGMGASRMSHADETMVKAILPKPFSSDKLLATLQKVIASN